MTCSQHETPLKKAVANGDIDIIKLLLEQLQGAQVDVSIHIVDSTCELNATHTVSGMFITNGGSQKGQHTHCQVTAGTWS